MKSPTKGKNQPSSSEKKNAAIGTSTGPRKPAYGVTHMLMNVRKRFKHLLDMPSVPERTNNESVTLGDVLDAIGAAEKFLLPFDGFLFEDHDLRNFLKFFKLPFPQIVLEYDGTTGKYGEPAGNDERVRVILFAKEMQHASTDVGAGVMVVVAYSSQMLPGEWILMPTTIFIPYGSEMGQFEADINQTMVGPLYPLEFAPYFDDMQFERDNADFRTSVNAVFKESLSLFHFCNAVNCSNVTHETVPAPKFINLKRKAKGLPPLYEYRILTVDTRPHNEAGEPKGGTHASPRQHIRRGTLRHYKSGKTVWVNAMVVGDPARGRIDKDYEVRKPK